MSVTKAEIAQRLADVHFAIEEDLIRIFRIGRQSGAEEQPSEPIKLLEINAATVPSGILPLHFGPLPDRGIPFASVIIEVTPEEFSRIEAHELSLPQDWRILEELPRPVGTGA